MLKIFLFVTLLTVFRQASSEKPRIAIVGAGIGGSSCSHFLRDHLNDDIDIDLYEAHRIGGRLATAEYAEEIYEIGGCAIHERNRYMDAFRQKFLLTKFWSLNNLIAIRDSGGFRFCSSTCAIIMYAKFIWNYGITSIWRLQNFINNLLNQFDRIYEFQEKGNSFSTVEKLFEAVDANFSNYFKTSVKEGFRTRVSMNKKTIEDLVRATLRVNYGQSTEVHMFVGAVSASGIFSPQWGIKDGVRQIPELLVQGSSINFLKNRVVKITFDKPSKEYIVESVSTATNQNLVKNYDIVVIANPITSDSKTPIEFENFQPPIRVGGRYQRVVATLVAGNVNTSYFKWRKNFVPDVIIDNDDPVISSISKSRAVTEVLSVSTQLWKIFSHRPLNEAELNAMFQTPKVVAEKDWLAYPKYEQLNVEDGNFILHDGLFYVNAIEWAASAMEMSVIGAKNVALLVEKRLLSTGKLGRKKQPVQGSQN